MNYSEKEVVERLCQDHKEVFLNEKSSNTQYSRNYIGPYNKSTPRIIHSRGANKNEYVCRNSGVLQIKSETIRDYARKLEKNINAKSVLLEEKIKNCSYSGNITNEILEQVSASIKLVSPADCISYEGIASLSFNPDYWK